MAVRIKLSDIKFLEDDRPGVEQRLAILALRRPGMELVYESVFNRWHSPDKFKSFVLQRYEKIRKYNQISQYFFSLFSFCSVLTEGQTLCDTVVVNEETYSVSPQIKRVVSCIGSYLTVLLMSCKLLLCRNLSRQK